MSKFYHRLTQNYVRRMWERREGSALADPAQRLENLQRMRSDGDEVLDDQTWEDLNLPDELARMNKTYSSAGEQMLYNMLRTPIFDEAELQRRDSVIQLMHDDPALREKVQCLMYYLGKRSNDSISECLYKGLVKPPHGMGFLIPLTLGMLASIIALLFIHLKAVILIFAFAMINMTIHFTFVKETDRAMPGIRGVARMLEIAEELTTYPNAGLQDYYIGYCKEILTKCHVILDRVRAYGTGSAADPFGFSAILQILFLSEERTYTGCAHYVEEYTQELRELYCRLGELDALQAVASYRDTLTPLCTPQFVPDRTYLKATRIGHPALRTAVCNDITLEHKNLVLTGSNMSGKSTFLRTIGLNAVLAQTFYMVKAGSYVASMFRIATSISPADSLAEGKSYYMSEAESLLRMLPLCEGETSALLLIDEIFRGTNPAERVAAASSLLTYLSQRNCLIGVATHDIEITRNVQNLYESYHFEEQVSRDTLTFDYILRRGVLRKPNGIHILEYLGFPDEITQPALAAARAALPE